MRNLHIERLWNMTETLNVLHPDNWTHEATQILDNYTEEVYKATKNDGWEFDQGDVKEKELQWSFAGALLYSITVITTIGRCIILYCIPLLYKLTERNLYYIQVGLGLALPTRYKFMSLVTYTARIINKYNTCNNYQA